MVLDGTVVGGWGRNVSLDKWPKIKEYDAVVTIENISK